jgi:hypothetical protein
MEGAVQVARARKQRSFVAIRQRKNSERQRRSHFKSLGRPFSPLVAKFIIIIALQNPIVD